MNQWKKNIPKIFLGDNWNSVPIQENSDPLVEIGKDMHPNIIIKPIYKELEYDHALDKIIIRSALKSKLFSAASKLPENTKLVLLDGWRPLSLQNEVYLKAYNKYRKQFKYLNDADFEMALLRFVKPPSKNIDNPSPHLTGGSIDVTLSDNNGNLDMGTEFDDFSKKAETSHFEENQNNYSQVVEHRRLLYNIMLEEGFTNYPYEWWHYDYGNQLWGYFKGKTAFYSFIE